VRDIGASINPSLRSSQLTLVPRHNSDINTTPSVSGVAALMPMPTMAVDISKPTVASNRIGTRNSTRDE
jgi:hypothetical protein